MLDLVRLVRHLGRALAGRFAFVLALSLALPALAGCAADTADTPSLTGTWVYTNARGTGGVGLSFADDGRYVAQILVLTSDTSAQVQLETGRYTATSASIAFTPEQSTCPDDPGTPSTVGYSLASSTLTVQFPDGAIVLERNTSSTSSSFALQYGCGRTGRFVRAPLAPVKR